ncbi:MAG: thiamine-phosphate kinase [Bacteroidales bacterium]
MIEFEDAQPRRTELAELGEFGLIEELTGGLKQIQKSTLKGVGDDCAVLGYGDEAVLVTKDLLVEGIHFDLTYTPLKHLGYKAAVVNFSDVVAMNGTPRQIVVGLGASNRFSLEALQEIYAGIRLACETYKVDLVGGDTVSSRSGLILSITCIGSAPHDKVVYRDGARKGDLIFVSGNLGAAYMGLMVLEREKQEFKANPNMQPDLEGHDYIIGRQLKPEARTGVLELLEKAGVKPTAMIDVSDGLASDLLHICHRSDLGCRLYEEKIPVDVETAMVAEEFKLDPTLAALSGGEDYELLFTVRQSDFDKLKDLKEVTVIGHMTDAAEGRFMVSRSDTLITLTAQGWDAFLKRQQEGKTPESE